ncbi:MAG TPA: 30S ribosomal protein S12 methylthiotransferase RimO [Spirochaetia bacterium]|nr:30S ribosomal protein S12 methylthiotransferase RimO [Spirochaetia bacterium]
MKKTFYLESLGCAKNQVDSEVMIAALVENEWKHVQTPDEAEVIIVNSCGFIAPAKEESIQVALEFHAQFPDRKVVMAGCLSQRYGAELAAGMPEISGFFGNRAPERVPEFLERSLDGGASVFLPDASESSPADSPTVFAAHRPVRRTLLSLPGSAYVKIAEGCNNRCAFCAIPMIRGDLRSRALEDVIQEIRELLDRGLFELNLVAHDLNSFGRDRATGTGSRQSELPRLLEAISRLPGKFWIRLLYLYPETFPMEILPLLSSDSRFLPYLDLPMQHASADILHAMGRSGRRESYLSLIETVRHSVPEVVIRSTFLVGYPGESDEQFDELLAFQAEAAFDWLGLFAYSPEEGTRGYLQQRTRGRVPAATARARKTELERRQRPISEERMERFVGRELEVLIEEPVIGEDLAFARAYLQAPEVDGAVVVRGSGFTAGRTLAARIIRRNGIDLEAVPV